KVGLYLSPWDRNSADYGNAEYVKYFQNQISELINEYCNDIDLFEYWFDGANGGDGYYGGARERRSINPKEYYEYEKCVEIIHKKFPRAMIFGGTVPTIRWVGNESGWAGETSWAMKSRSYTESKQNQYGDIDGEDWLPSEVDVSIRPGWFYHKREDHQVKSLSKLVDIYYESVGRNANLILNFPVSLSGKIHPTDSSRIVEWWQTIQSELKTDLLTNATVESSNSRGGDFRAKKVNDGDWNTYWATADSVVKADLTFTFDKPTMLNRVMLQEYIPLGQRVKSFSIEYLADGKWSYVPSSDSMTTVGYKRIIRFENITTEKLRVNFLDARGPLTINTVSAFLAPALMVEPAISRSSDGLVEIKGGDKSSKIFYSLDLTEPNIPYVKPFELIAKGTVRAKLVDAASATRVSPVSSKTFDVLTKDFTVKGVELSGKMFDGNAMSAVVLPAKMRDINISLNKTYTVKGFTYLPDQSRGGGGVIALYEIWAGGKKIAQGEFSNIKANPIEQIVMFDKAVQTSDLRLVCKSLADGTGDRVIVAEFGIITE
ncbi:MAG: discoidin domain-containing protein, partial [Rikenellaceae bacterium]